MHLRLWGTRGTIPTPEAENGRYGGNTPCIEVRSSEDDLLILDAGIGLHWLGDELMMNSFGGGEGRGHILVSHTHWSHIQGIPFFLPMLISGNRFSIYGTGGADSFKDLLLEQMTSYYCPVPNFFDDSIGALTRIEEIDEREFAIGSTRVTARRVNHVPDVVTLGFRIEDAAGGSLAYIPDVEYLEQEHRDQTLELAAGVDMLIHDAHQTTDEYPARRGRGHSSVQDAIEIARQAQARHLVLFHHHPDRSDSAIDDLLRSCDSVGLRVDAAREGAEYTL